PVRRERGQPADLAGAGHPQRRGGGDGGVRRRNLTPRPPSLRGKREEGAVLDFLPSPFRGGVGGGVEDPGPSAALAPRDYAGRVEEDVVPLQRQLEGVGH